jgi:hypothetical protein
MKGRLECKTVYVVILYERLFTPNFILDSRRSKNVKVKTHRNVIYLCLVLVLREVKHIFEDLGKGMRIILK